MSKESAMALASGGAVVTPSQNASNIDVKGSPVDSQQSVDSKVAPPDELASTQFNVFAKKEARLVQEQQQLKAEKEQLAAIKKQIEDFESLRKTNPVEALKQLGFSDTDIYNFLANEQPKELSPAELATKAVQEELKKYKEEQEKLKSDGEAKANAEIISTFKGNIGNTLKDKADKYPLSNFNAEGENGARELAFAVVEATLQESGEVLTPEEALELTESYYEMVYDSMNSLKKPVPKPQEQPKIDPKPPERVRQPASKTITNSMTATSSSQTQLNETRSQKKERLMALLRNGGLTK